MSNLNKSYAISEASDKTNVEIHTLRYWEKKGLIVPIRTSSGRRRYSDNHIVEILRLKKLINDEKLHTTAVKKYLNNLKTNQNLNYKNKKIKVFLKGLKYDIKQILKMMK